MQLSHLAIIVVHCSDGSGTTNIFISYLSPISGSWSAGPGVGLFVTWHVGLGAEGGKVVAETVKGAPGTIGYLELNYAKQTGVSVASIQNAAGEFVLPTPASTTKAITAFDEPLANDVRTPIVDPPASAKGAYPIVGVTFLLVRRDGNDVKDRQAVKDFIAYALSQGQDSAEGLSYARLPQSVSGPRATAAHSTQGGRPAIEMTRQGRPVIRSKYVLLSGLDWCSIQLFMESNDPLAPTRRGRKMDRLFKLLTQSVQTRLGFVIRIWFRRG